MVEHSGNLMGGTGMTGNVVGMFTTDERNVCVDVPSERDNTFNLMHTPDVSLNDFLARPVRICEYVVPVGSTLSATESPSYLFFTQKRIANRISNYAFISGRLHIKIIVTGTAFHYGKIVYAYEPMAIYRAARANTGTYPILQQYLQLPYASVDVNATEGSILSYELLHPYGAVDLTNLTANVNRTDRVYIAGLGPLRAVGDTTNPITVTAYAWMTDVKLSLPTITNITDLVEQSGEYAEDNQHKPSTIDKVGQVMGSMVNNIKPYAKATMDALGTGLQIAQMFGFSRPSIAAEVRHIVNRPVGNLAACNVVDTSVKLALDAKNEVTVDPRVLGLVARDEMSITDIASREFLMSQFVWATTDVSRKVLRRWAVTPCISFPYLTGYLPAPCYMVSLPFRYWRGTMYYRIEIIASAFHKGMLRVVYDPKNELTQTLIGEEDNDNVIYSHVIDITKTRNYEFCVGMGTNLSYLRVFGLGNEVIKNGTTAIPSIYNAFAGYVAVQTLLPLTTTATSPSVTNSDVEINVYCRAGPDFEVADPMPTSIQGWSPLNTTYIESSGAVESSSGLVEPLSPTMICLNNVQEYADSGELALTHFGEKITSIRQLLSRYTLLGNSTITLTTGLLRSVLCQLPAFPIYRGPSLTPVFGPSFNNVRVSYINWFAPCFMGWRGSIRWKIQENLDRTGTRLFTEATYRSSAAGFARTNDFISYPASEDNFAKFLTDTCARIENGASVIVGNLNPVHEVEMPYHYQERFKFCGILDTESQPPTTGTPERVDTFTRSFAYTVDGTRYMNSTYYVAAGDDFTLHFFKYTVVLYFTTLPITP